MKWGVVRVASRSFSFQPLRYCSHSPSSSTIDTEDIRNFAKLSSQWSDENGPFKALHSLNMLRVPWILRNIGKKEASIVDVGCGGGLLSIPLARAGLHVTGIDATNDAITAARSVLKSRPLEVTGLSDKIAYYHGTVESFSREHENDFDAVVASEIVEHVADLDAFVEGCVRLAKPGAPLFFTTISRTLASRVLAIWIAEQVLKIVPPGIHQWNKFVQPQELTQVLERWGCTVRAINGFTYNPFTNRFYWLPSTAVNYACVATKN